MEKKLVVRLLIVFAYFFVDIIYTILKSSQVLSLNTLIEKVLLFTGISFSVYLITRTEENRKDK
jgi:hypothetical protein